MLFFVLSIDCDVMSNANGSLAITIRLVNLELEDILTHS